MGKYRPFVVTWTRNNIVQRALSHISYESTCHEHNFRSKEKAAACATSKYTVQKRSLLKYVRNCVCENAKIAEVSKEVAGDDQVHTMLYEDFARNRSEELAQLFRYFRLRTKIKMRSSKIVKRSATNVTTMLLNADEVVELLKSWELQSLPLLEMLRDTTYRTFVYNASAACD